MGRVDSVSRMQQRFLGATGLSVSRLGLGTMTWGRDTDEHEAREQLVAFLEAGGTLLDTAAGYTDGDSERLIGSLLGDVCDRDDVVLATKAGIGRRGGERFTNASRGHLLRSLDASLEAARRRPRRPVAGAHLGRRRPPRGDAVGAGHGRQQRPGGVRRGQQLQRLAVRAGRHLAARGSGPGRAGLQPGGVLPAQPLGRGRGDPGRRRRSASGSCPGRRWAGVSSRGSTAPARPPTRERPPRTSPRSSAATCTRRRSASSRPWPAPPTAWA